jgi:hypothetical protein
MNRSHRRLGLLAVLTCLSLALALGVAHGQFGPPQTVWRCSNCGFVLGRGPGPMPRVAQCPNCGANLNGQGGFLGARAPAPGNIKPAAPASDSNMLLLLLVGGGAILVLLVVGIILLCVFLRPRRRRRPLWDDDYQVRDSD